MSPFSCETPHIKGGGKSTGVYSAQLQTFSCKKLKQDKKRDKKVQKKQTR